MVKADAYGHGAVAVSLELERLGIDGLAVARVGEVGELRRSGIRSPLLLLGGPASIEELARAVDWDATPVLTRREQVADWSAWRRRTCGSGTPLDVVVELDTGMSRYGVPLDQWPGVLREVRSAPELQLIGLMSHLAESELPKSGFTALQEQRFAGAVGSLDPGERGTVSLHLANSSGALRRVSARWDAVRVGGALYGLDLAAGADPPPASGLRPVMRVVAPILDLRRVQAGTGVGYRRSWRAPRDAMIALVPVGYGDGFSTGLGVGDVLVGGVRCPIAGQVSMDSLTVDVTGVPGVMVGDECVLLGSQGDERIEVAELAARAGVAAYEVCCGFNSRLPREVLGPERPSS